MIRMFQCRSAAQAEKYFDDELSLAKSEYFINEQELAGRFYGRIAERLNIVGTAERYVFQDLCENIHPVTGKSLTPRNRDNRTIGYDINFHCPKSVSVLHVLTRDDHILDAFRQSVQDTMRDMEADSKTRVRRHGQDTDRDTGELLWAEFVHQTARPVDGSAPDPHLHAHCFTFNVTFDPVERQFKAGQFRDIKRDMPYYQARFHKRLADNLMALGYQIRRTRTSFEVENIPENVINLFSKRTNEIGQFIRDKNIIDAREKDKIGERTRAKKRKDLTMSQLKKEWRRQIHASGMMDKGTGGKAIRFAKGRRTDVVTADECVNFAVSDKFERASVVHDRRLLESAYRFALGKDGATLDGITEQFRQDKRIIQVKDGSKLMCTTKEVLSEEHRMVALAVKGKGKLAPLYPVPPAMSLTGQQATAASHVLTTPDRVSLISGRAGTGKTTMMTETVRLIEKTGVPVTVVAPTSSASRGTLRQEGFREAETVAKLLTSPEMQKRLKNGVLWCDEAGLLGTKDLLALLELVTKQNCRLICSGDSSQHSAVSRGDGMRILSSVAGIRPAQISKIYRQKNREYKEAVQAISDGDIRTGFSKLESIGAIHEMDPDHPYDGLANSYVFTLKQKKTALVICPTHAQGAEVTKTIRGKLREAGLLDSKERQVLSLAPLSMTAAEKSDSRNYQPGHVLQFSQNRKGIIRGSRWSVISGSRKELLLENDKGKMILFPLARTEDFEVYKRTEIPLAKGDMIRVTRNGSDAKDKRLNNGQLLKVSGLDKKGRIICRSLAGKTAYTLGPEFGHVAYAHCLTSHAAQGQTVDACYVAQPAASFPATNLKQFYVSVSRGREGVHIYTDDREALLRHVSEAGNRESALELIHKAPRRHPFARTMRQRMRPPDHPTQSPDAPPVISPTSMRKHEPKPAP